MCVNLELVIDYVGFPDFYRGHGHAFSPPDLIACVRFGFSVSYQETVREIKDLIEEEINRTWSIEYLDTSPEAKKMVEAITDEDIRRVINETIKGEDNEEYFKDIPEDLRIPEDWEGDNPMLIGYLHIYRL
ncbi:MAG: hypothetical protein DRO11_10235 [Methanobacteriota archaeon]|nr:MAG: hypothetical protein DRO11_10235 [Euryarchaeota archaeon]